MEQLQFVFQKLFGKVQAALPKEYAELGTLISIDGTLIDAVLSMYWADYRKGAKKAKEHFSFNINQGVPAKVFLADGKGVECPFVNLILSPGQIGVIGGISVTRLLTFCSEKAKILSPESKSPQQKRL